MLGWVEHILGHFHAPAIFLREFLGFISRNWLPWCPVRKCIEHVIVDYFGNHVHVAFCFSQSPTKPSVSHPQHVIFPCTASDHTSLRKDKVLRLRSREKLNHGEKCRFLIGRPGTALQHEPLGPVVLPPNAGPHPRGSRQGDTSSPLPRALCCALPRQPRLRKAVIQSKAPVWIAQSSVCRAACLFAQYIAESGTKEPGYLKELYVTGSHTQRVTVFAGSGARLLLQWQAGDAKKKKKILNI